MATGGWLAGLLYDHFGYYAPAFAAGIGANLLNLLVVGVLVVRQRYRQPCLTATPGGISSKSTCHTSRQCGIYQHVAQTSLRCR